MIVSIGVVVVVETASVVTVTVSVLIETLVSEIAGSSFFNIRKAESSCQTCAWFRRDRRRNNRHSRYNWYSWVVFNSSGNSGRSSCGCICSSCKRNEGSWIGSNCCRSANAADSGRGVNCGVDLLESHLMWQSEKKELKAGELGDIQMEELSP